MTQIAGELPLRLMCEMLGVPAEDRHRLSRWTNCMLASTDPEYAVPLEEGGRIAREMIRYLNELGEDRRREPRDDPDQRDPEWRGVRPQAYAPGVQLLLPPPLQCGNRDDAQPDLPRNEALVGASGGAREAERPNRPCSPWRSRRCSVTGHPRCISVAPATRDTEIRGMSIRKGDKVTLWYPSANRDEDVFPQPDVFDITPERRIRTWPSASASTDAWVPPSRGSRSA